MVKLNSFSRDLKKFYILDFPANWYYLWPILIRFKIRITHHPGSAWIDSVGDMALQSWNVSWEVNMLNGPSQENMMGVKWSRIKFMYPKSIHMSTLRTERAPRKKPNENIRKKVSTGEKKKLSPWSETFWLIFKCFMNFWKSHFIKSLFYVDRKSVV